MQVTIKIDSAEFEKGLSALKGDVPWVQSNTINDLLKGAQVEQYAHMRQVFNIRNNAFLKYSLRITQFAKKQTLTGTLGIVDVGTRDTSKIWELFEGGGTKQPQGKYIAIPSLQTWNNRGRKLPERNRPRNLQRSFVIESKGKKLIMNRIGKKPKKDSTGRDKNVRVMYNLAPGIRIPDRLGFYATTIPYIERNYQPTFDRLLGISLAKNGFK